MTKKQSPMANQYTVVAMAILVLVLGTIFLINTDIGRRILGIKLEPVTSSADSEKFRKADRKADGQYIVVLNESNAQASVVDQESNSLSQRYGGSRKKVFSRALKGFTVNMTEAQAIALSKDPAVAYVEEDAITELNAIQTNATWGLDRMDQRALPLSTTYEYNQTGTGVNIYVIDTGIRTTHVEFGGRARIGYDAVYDGQNGNDCHGHGTHVAGTIGSSTYGVAKQATLYAVRVMDCAGSGLSSQLLEGIEWVTANRVNPAVVNVSMQVSGSSSAVNTAVSNSIASGVTYAIAAGNNAANACQYSPASVTSAITVGAIGSSDTRWSGSNYGNCVDIHAPGISITSTYIGSDTATAILGGTSMAAPHAAGVAALYLQQYPQATPSSVANAIVSSGTPNILTNVPSGTANLLLYSVLTGVTPPPPPPGPTDTTAPVVNITTPANGSTLPRKGNVKITVTASDSSGIATLAISMDGVTIKTCSLVTSCTASISANGISNGTHTIVATAVDRATPPNTGTRSIQVTK